MTQTISRDPAADPTRVVWAKGGVEWVNDSQSSNIHGQWRWESGTAGWRLHGYDGAGRLVNVWDERVGSQCVARGYTYDVNSNRTQVQAWPAAADGACPPPTTPTTTGYSYDAADRLLPSGLHAGLAYDALGRTTTLPAADAGGTAASIGYYITDMVATQIQGTATRSWTLDPAGRLRAATASGSPTRTNHYPGAGDSPSWIDENTGATTLTATRYVGGLDGNLAAAVSYTGTSTTARWQLVNLHGDIVTTATDTTTLTTPDGATLDGDEYGQPTSSITARYGYLGGKQRSTDTLAGLVLMGVRRYAPALGRFLSRDPVPGGSANAYEYCGGDPVNCVDLDGRRARWLWVRGAVLTKREALRLARALKTGDRYGEVTRLLWFIPWFVRAFLEAGGWVARMYGNWIEAVVTRRGILICYGLYQRAWYAWPGARILIFGRWSRMPSCRQLI